MDRINRIMTILGGAILVVIVIVGSNQHRQPSNPLLTPNVNQSDTKQTVLVLPTALPNSDLQSQHAIPMGVELDLIRQSTEQINAEMFEQRPDEQRLQGEAEELIARYGLVGTKPLTSTQPEEIEERLGTLREILQRYTAGE